MNTSKYIITGNKDVDRQILLLLSPNDLRKTLLTPLKDIADDEFWKLKLSQDYPGLLELITDEPLSEIYWSASGLSIDLKDPTYDTYQRMVETGYLPIFKYYHPMIQGIHPYVYVYSHTMSMMIKHAETYDRYVTFIEWLFDNRIVKYSVLCEGGILKCEKFIPFLIIKVYPSLDYSSRKDLLSRFKLFHFPYVPSLSNQKLLKYLDINKINIVAVFELPIDG